MSESEVLHIIEENKRHFDALFSEYDPLTGIGSPIERVRLNLTSEGKYILIPKYISTASAIKEMLDYSCLEEYIEAKHLTHDEVYDVLFRLRVKYDFEYWAATCATIFDKTSGQEVKFKLRKAQRKLLKVLVEQAFSLRPIRVILVKARQWGGSTLIQLFCAWIQLFHRKNWNSVIATHIEEAARNIRSMYTLVAERHPKDILDIKFRAFEGSSKNKQIVDRGCVIYIGSMERPNSLHSGNYKLVHCSEVGYWKETTNRKPSDFVNAFEGSVPLEPFTLVALESTAKGTGNFFHTTWLSATKGENAYTPIFVAWWEIDMYTLPFESYEDMKMFVESMNDYELWAFSLGATLEGLHWYREKRKGFDNDWDMQEQFPTTADEAFVTSGRKAHHPLHIKQMEVFAKKPEFIGEMFADAPSGEEAINNSLQFKELIKGDFYVWKKPDTTRLYNDRYVVSLDIGGSAAKADWSVIRVLDRLPMMNGGVPEFVATYRFHMDQDLTAWRAVQVAKWYCNALLVVEANVLNTFQTEGNFTSTVLDIIAHVYPHLYYRDDPNKIKEGLPTKYGFWTSKNKSELVTTITAGLREMGFIERDQRMLDECGWYELKQDGSYGAIDGQHDDIYISSAINLWVSNKLPIPTPIPTLEEKAQGMRRQRVRTEADM
ncbi:MAG: hypothetical protein J6C56_04815 [Alistipes sp.]|nr:hypothetical protein [Alistipes sp.]